MQPVRILLVEDDPGHQYLLGLAMSSGRPFVNVSAARNRDEFASAIARQDFDCVVTDYNLLDCTADELLCMLKKAQPHCPAIVVSGSDDQAVVVRSMRNGSVDFVHKDDAVEGDRLWDRIKLVLADRRRKRNERRQTERRIKRLSELALTDPLTGLANRRGLTESLAGTGRRGLDRRGEATVVMLDIDHFKRVNDAYGHPGGDQALRAVAACIQDCADRRDTVCRWGGEEFLVLKPACGLARGVRWAERLRHRIATERINLDGRLLAITVSAGVATVDALDFGEDAIQRADDALYFAKRHGRNRCCTAEFVDFERLLSTADATDPVGRLERLLTRAQDGLGPTQREHLVDHSLRVGRTAVRIGARLGLKRARLRALHFAGRCHDLGKFCVPECVLAKPARLNDDETFLVARHSAEGAEMMRMLGSGAETAEFVRFHHARFDDPDSESGNAIPQEAHILCVADALVSMTTDRPYQPARSLPAAIREIRAHSGTQFAPAVTRAVAALGHEMAATAAC
jgi:diguanylate cyclase (GGDEF)-like protein